MTDFVEISESENAASTETQVKVDEGLVHEISEKVVEVEAAISELDVKIDDVSENVSLIATADGGSGSSVVDYSEQLEAIGKNVALCNTLLIVICVSLFLIAGMRFGHIVVEKFRS